jgi:MFS family permease
MTTLADVAAPARARLLTRPLMVRFVSVIGTATSFYLLLSAVPLYARSAGASTGLAGLTTTALTLSSVAAYPVTPRLMARYGTRAVLAGGLLALGVPALALAITANIGLILAACVVRGAGFAVLCVAGGALTVSLIPAHRRGEGLALVGLVSGVPGVAALPLGVWLAGHLPAAAVAGRWLAGRRGDRPSNRQGSAALLVPGVLAAAAGVLVLSLTAVPAAVIAGAAVFGLGFGVTQNVTQTVMYDRVPESAFGASSALWNLTYDGGMGLGAAGFGVLALYTGYPVAFVLVAAILAAAVLPAALPALTRARAAARSE